MRVEFRKYDEKATDVYVWQDTMSLSTTHITIENKEDDDGEGIYIYMSEPEIQGFIDKLQNSLNKRQDNE